MEVKKKKGNAAHNSHYFSGSDGEEVKA